MTHARDEQQNRGLANECFGKPAENTQFAFGNSDVSIGLSTHHLGCDDAAYVKGQGLAVRIAREIASGLARFAERVSGTGGSPETVNNSAGQVDIGEVEMTSHISAGPQGRWLFTFLILTNFIQASIMVIVFKVPPSALMQEVETVKIAVDEMRRTIGERGSLIQTVNDMKSTLNNRPVVSLEKDEFDKWCVKARELNPEIVLPKLEDVLQ